MQCQAFLKLIDNPTFGPIQVKDHKSLRITIYSPGLYDMKLDQLTLKNEFDIPQKSVTQNDRIGQILTSKSIFTQHRKLTRAWTNLSTPLQIIQKIW